jgi:hypothetical protein
MSDSILENSFDLVKTAGNIAKNISKAIVEDNFDYKDGKVFWKKRKAKCIQIGNEAGHLWSSRKDGVKHWIVKLDGRRLKRSRIVWVMHFGEIQPGIEIDHIDRETLNDRVENLRQATRSENCINRGMQKNNTSGLRGVRFYEPLNKWLSRINYNGKSIHIGYFDTKEEAYLAYLKTANDLHQKWNPMI